MPFFSFEKSINELWNLPDGGTLFVCKVQVPLGLLSIRSRRPRGRTMDVILTDARSAPCWRKMFRNSDWLSIGLAHVTFAAAQ